MEAHRPENDSQTVNNQFYDSDEGHRSKHISQVIKLFLTLQAMLFI